MKNNEQKQESNKNPEESFYPDTFNNRVSFGIKGIVLAILALPFILLGIFSVTLAITEGKPKFLAAGLFMIFLGSPIIYALRLTLGDRRTDGGLFPPLFIFSFGVMLICFSIDMLFFENHEDKPLMIFDYFFGVACIHKAYSRWQHNKNNS